MFLKLTGLFWEEFPTFTPQVITYDTENNL